MAKKKSSKKEFLYFLPLILQLIIHILGSATLIPSSSGIPLWPLIGAALISLMAIGLGEGYASIAFIVAGTYDRIGVYITVIILSIVSVCASFAGYMISGIEGQECLWMTLLFCCIDIFLFVFSIVRIVRLSAKKRNL